MRFPIKVSPGWRPIFTIFGFSQKRAYIDLEDDALQVRFGTADERIELDDITKIEPRKWPFYYGLGAKIGPAGGVSYVLSGDGVVTITFAHPRPMNVWGPFAVKKAKALTVSLEDPERFMEAVTDARHKRADARLA